jgi:tetratricopeptide (TPR) repeat protein
LLVGLLVPAVLLGLVIYPLQSHQVRRNARALLERADRAEQQGDFRNAEQYLQLFLGYEPSDATALAKFGLILASRARTVDDRISAILMLEKALGTDPSRRDVRRRLIDISMSLMRFSDAQRHLKVLLGKDEPGEKGDGRKYTPEDGELEFLIGQCAEGEPNSASAALWYRDAIAHAPGQIDCFVRLAELLRTRLLDSNGADRVMDAQEVNNGLIAANPRNFRAYLARGLYRRKYKIDGADQDVARALELAPEDADALLTATAFAIDRGELELARRQVELGLKLHPRSWRLSAALAWIERKTGRTQEAQACLRRGIDASPEQEGRLQLLWALAEEVIEQGDWTEAKRLYERLAKEGVQPDLLKFLDARITAAEGKWPEAVTKLEALYPLLEAKPELALQADLILGFCYQQLGDLERRYLAFHRAAAHDPGGVSGHLGLAAALEDMGRIEEALGEIRRVRDQTAGTGIAEARLLILRNMRRPSAQRDWAEVDQVLDKLSQTNRAAPEVIIMRAEALVAQGHLDLAHALLKTASDHETGRIEFWIALAELAERRETPEAALSILKEAEQRFGDRIELRLAQASYWARRGGPEALKVLGQLEGDLDTFGADDQERLLRSLGDAHLQLGDTAGAYGFVTRLAGQRPSDPTLRFAQFELALKLGDEAEMQLAVEQTRKLEDELRGPEDRRGVLWRCARGRHLLWLANRRGRAAIKKEEIDEARVLLAEARSQRPTWALVPLSEAELDELTSNPDGAIKGYLRAIELGMNSADVVRRTVQLLYDHRRYDEADEVIKKLLERGLGSSDLRLQRLAAEVSLRANDRARALEMARKSIAPDSKDYRDHLWLGQILWAAAEPQNAETELRRAVELTADAPEAWVTLVQFLSRTGQNAKARVVIAQARSRLSGAEAALTLARCYAELGDVSEARAQLQAALAARPDDITTLRSAATFAIAVGQPREAEADLRKIIDLIAKAPDDAAWARRLLATLLASTGNYRQWLDGLKLLNLTSEVESYQPADDEPIEDLRVLAKVLAIRKNRGARRAAIRILRHIVERQLPTPDDQSLLVQLYEDEGDWPKAHQQISGLIASEGANPLYLAQAVRSLVRHGALDEARACLETVEKIEPRSDRTIELKARMLIAEGETGKSVSSLNAFVKEKAEQAGTVAALLEELGQSVAAEEHYRRFAAQSRQPEAILVLAGFLGRQNRVHEALDLCEKAWASCRRETVARAIVAILYAAPIDEAQCRRAAQMFESQLKQAPTNPALLFHLGNVRCLQGRDQDAATLYQKSIEGDKANSGPVANLAWLLARRDGKGALALKLVAEAMLMDGPEPDLLDTRALAYLALGQADLAAKDLEDAIAVDPSPVKYVHLAEAYLMGHRRREASSALQGAKAAGLATEKLSPLERKPCLRLLEELAQK